MPAGRAEALNAQGNRALTEGHLAEARQLFEAAIGIAPGQAALRFNLAAALRAAGDPKGALEQLQAALAIDPYFVQAMFQKAVTLEELGRPREAARVYKDFLQCAPAGVLDKPQLQPALDRARQAVAADRKALGRLVEARLAAMTGGQGDSRRFDEAIAALLGRSPIHVAKPTFLTVPRLPAIPFFDRTPDHWLDRLEQAAERIAAELCAVVGEDAEAGGFTPYVANPPGVPPNQWRELNHSPRWSAYHFWTHGQRDEAHCARCPESAALLDEMPMIRLAGRAPNAFFSLLKPKTRIPAHHGVSNIRATVHLPLVVPAGCGFRVGAETRAWRPGTAWVFDDTIEHEAWNDSGEPRFILIFDVWNPLLTDAERQRFTAALAAFDEHYGQAGGWPDTL